MRHVVWTLDESFFFLSFFILFNTNNFFLVSIRSIYGIHKRERAGMPGMTKKGPNDVFHVIWAIGEVFFLSSYYLILMIILMYL